MNLAYRSGEADTEKRTNETKDDELVERFAYDPDGAYAELLRRYSTILLRMIRRFMRDSDEIMEVYTAVCEKLYSNDYQALRRFRIDSELAPWLSVVVANACRDRFRKRRAVSVPKSVLSRLNKREQLVFRYFYQDRLPHEDIVEKLKGKNGIFCTVHDVVADIQKIDDLLSIKKRWHLLAALNSNRPLLSIDELAEDGFEASEEEEMADFELSFRNRETIDQLTEAMGKLNHEDQLLVQLRFEQDLSAIQIAEIMQYDNHKYVYTRLRTIVQRLRRLLGDQVAYLE